MVPCEAGCDGPICSSMISSAGSEASIFCDQRAGNGMMMSPYLVGLASGFVIGSISGTIGCRFWYG